MCDRSNLDNRGYGMTQLNDEHFEKSLASANILIGKLQQRLDVLVSATEEWSNL